MVSVGGRVLRAGGDLRVVLLLRGHPNLSSSSG